ncbi:MAG: mechanosensitive ion channel domain-containing protein [Kiritimatiellia bacterium]
MRTYISKILIFLLLVSISLKPCSSAAIDVLPDPVPETVPAVTPQSKAPSLEKIIPLATQLAGQQVALESQIKGLPDIPTIEKQYAEIDSNLSEPTQRLEIIRAANRYSGVQVEGLLEAIRQQSLLFEDVNKGNAAAIRELERWRGEWLEQKNNWSQWRKLFITEDAPIPLTAAFDQAGETIEAVLNLIRPRLNAMLTAQQNAAAVKRRILALSTAAGNMISTERRDVFLTTSPPILSEKYYLQFSDRSMWHGIVTEWSSIYQQENRLMRQQGWIIMIDISVCLFFMMVFYQKRKILIESKRWSFLAKRPLASGWFFGTLTSLLIYNYMPAPAIWALVNIITGGISFARICNIQQKSAWINQLLNGLITILIITKVMKFLNISLPIFRLFTFLAALTGFLFCLRQAILNARKARRNIYAALFYAGAFAFFVILIVEMWGGKNATSHVFVASVDSVIIVLIFRLFINIINGGMEWAFQNSALKWKGAFSKSETHSFVRTFSHLIEFLVWGILVLPSVLIIWGVYPNLKDATSHLLQAGVTFGSRRITIGLVMISAGIIYGSVLTSWVLRKMLMTDVLLKRKMERGVRHSIAQLLHYAIICIGVLIALSALGFELSKLTLMLGALGIGIGFGLQGVVNNFVCGLILLFERPVRVGDTVEISGTWAEIKTIGLRATTVHTSYKADVIIPNAELINTQVTNWTLSNRQVRLNITVGVAYGSDIALVMKTLAECAAATDNICQSPKPQVLFMEFGPSSLGFELRVSIVDADYRLEVRSALHQIIDQRFRENNIVIAFPQMDLHLCSGSDAIGND